MSDPKTMPIADAVRLAISMIAAQSTGSMAPVRVGVVALEALIAHATAPIPLLLMCPSCGERHFDEGDWAEKSHHTHTCQHCGMTWRPCVFDTMGVRFLPGIKND